MLLWSLYKFETRESLKLTNIVIFVAWIPTLKNAIVAYHVLLDVVMGCLYAYDLNVG